MYDDLGLVLPPLAIGLLILLSHVPLGREVLKRGIVFIDLAVAQVAGLGVVAAHALGGAGTGWATQLAAGTAALGGAALLVWLERRWPDLLEPLIGTLFILAACLAALLAAHDPHGGEQLRDLLIGQILWAGWRDVPATALLTLFLLLAWHSQRRRRPWIFYPCLALAVTTSVQLVGVYLVFASLILPALAVRGQPDRRGMPLAYLAGALGYGAGLLASVRLDLPAGPLIVTALALAAGAVAWLARKSA